MNIQKPTITLAIVIIIRGLAVGVVSIYLTQNTYAIKTGNCPDMDFLWEHTYGAGQSHWSPAQTHSRLKELSPACVVFTGNVTGPPEDTEHDGDLHFNVTPDNTKDNLDLLNVNNTNRYGMKVLVVEIICWDKPNYNTYSNFQGHFCDGVDPRAHIPALKQGDHIRVTGKWVKDVGYPKPDHPQWNEIHPVQSIQKLS